MLYWACVRRQSHPDVKWCEGPWVSQHSQVHPHYDMLRERERPDGESNTSGLQDSGSTYNAALGLGLNIQFQDSIAWGKREFGKFKTSAQSGRETANQLLQRQSKQNVL